MAGIIDQLADTASYFYTKVLFSVDYGPLKIFTAALATETNTFSPMRTSLSDFEASGLFRPPAFPQRPTEFSAPSWVARERAHSRGWHLVEGTCAYAPPGGITCQSDYELLRDEILEQLSAALPVDAVVMGMHGAMVAEGYPDCEGDLLIRIRRLVGAGTPIGVLLDPHCHLSHAMVSNANVVVMLKEYPHTDFLERAAELLDIVVGTAEKRYKPVMSVFDCRMLGIFHTTRDPMKSFVTRIKDCEERDRILSVSVAHGFPWGDVADGGTKMLVVTDNEPVLGDRLATSLGMELFQLRGRTHTPPEEMSAAIEHAASAGEGPIVLADITDNPGGGSPGDSTFILRELIDRKVRSACIGAIWDPEAVQAAMSAGIGENLQLRVGGKMGLVSGDPLTVDAVVTGLCKDAYQTFAGSPVALGDCAAISLGDIHVVLSSIRSQTLGLDLFENVDIDPAAQKLVVVKSSHHFHEAFQAIAREIHYLDGPGALSQDLQSIGYEHVSKNIWPFVDDPFAVDGRKAIDEELRAGRCPSK